MKKIPPRTYDSLLLTRRRRESTINDRTLTEETESDRGRVLFSSPIRRLQHKTQVFPLESNAAVRSRLTHSMEVAVIGRSIAELFFNSLSPDESRNLGLDKKRDAFKNIIETACLCHDIGNPPFGHFGESSLSLWFRANGKQCAASALATQEDSLPLTLAHTYLPDFENFDGNAQGFRILTRLQWDVDEYSLNLTHTQLASFIKYVAAPHEITKRGMKKPGYFHSEQAIVDDVWKALALEPTQRFPLNYIVEAADDIAYCLSDIEDGLEKGLVSEEELKNALTKHWAAQPSADVSNLLPELLEYAWGRHPAPPTTTTRFFTFKTSLVRTLVSQAAQTYKTNQEEILAGRAVSLLESAPTNRDALKCLKTFAQEKLFRSFEAESIELAGHATITGLLDHYRALLCVDLATMRLIINDLRGAPGLERRLYNLLPKKHRLAYVNHSKVLLDSSDPCYEWFLRAHLVVDFISGMTDRYALETYQLLSGIRVA